MKGIQHRRAVHSGYLTASVQPFTFALFTFLSEPGSFATFRGLNSNMLRLVSAH